MAAKKDPMMAKLIQKGAPKMAKLSSGHAPKAAKAMGKLFPQSSQVKAMSGMAQAKSTKAFGNLVKQNAGKSMGKGPRLMTRSGKY